MILRFFDPEDIQKFANRAGTFYYKDQPEQKGFNDRYIKALHEQTKYWANEVVKQIPGFCAKTKNYLGFNGQARVPHYTWARIVHKDTVNLGIYFTVGVDASTKSLIVKLDYERVGNTRGKSRRLSEVQRAFCSHFLSNPSLQWQFIQLDKLKELSWDILIKNTVKYISQRLTSYETLLEAIWCREEAISISKLIQEDPPLPQIQLSDRRRGRPALAKTIDYEEQYRTMKFIGDLGEQLVLDHEIETLNKIGRRDLAKKVCKQPDGAGYDILSFNSLGKEKYIEVKTTVSSNSRQPFQISLKELEFIKDHLLNAYIYRLYNLSIYANKAKFFILSGEGFIELKLQPTAYKAIL